MKLFIYVHYRYSDWTGNLYNAILSLRTRSNIMVKLVRHHNILDLIIIIRRRRTLITCTSL